MKSLRHIESNSAGSAEGDVTDKNAKCYAKLKKQKNYF